MPPSKNTLDLNACPSLDPFGGTNPSLLRRGKEALLRVNPEPSTRAQAEGQPQAFRPGSRRGDIYHPQQSVTSEKCGGLLPFVMWDGDGSYTGATISGYVLSHIGQSILATCSLSGSLCTQLPACICCANTPPLNIIRSVTISKAVIRFITSHAHEFEPSSSGTRIAEVHIDCYGNHFVIRWP